MGRAPTIMTTRLLLGAAREWLRSLARGARTNVTTVLAVAFLLGLVIAHLSLNGWQWPPYAR